MEFDNKFLDSTSQFTGELYQQTIHGVHGNAVVSPISIMTALSFLMFGATGKTLTQMKSSLKYNEIPNEDLENNFQRLTEHLGTGGLSVANKIYLMKGYSVKPTFNQIATKSFHSEVESLDFAESVESSKNINHWVESKTNNKIKDLIKPDFLNADTKLVLVNALYFKGDWKRPFNSRVTSKKPFFKNEDETVELDFMSQKSSFNYGKFDDLDATAVELPYKDSDVKMMIILPNSKTGLSAVESKLNEINFSDLSKRMHSRSVRVVIPKFKIEFDVNLEEPLTKLGMGRMFTNAAEFGNLLEGPVKVSKAVHKAFIEVHEKGSEAGAATAMGVNKVSLGTHFQADRPFLFALIEDSNVLFIGRKVQ